MDWIEGELKLEGNSKAFSSTRWVCGDGDHAYFYLDLDKKEIYLSCFNGSGEQIRFAVWEAPSSNKFNLNIEEFPGNFNPSEESFIEYSKWACDRLCSLFCDRIDHDIKVPRETEEEDTEE